MRIRHTMTVVAALAGLALVAGCGNAGGTGDARRIGGAPARVEGGRPSAPAGSGATGSGATDSEPPPVSAAEQPRSTFALDVDTASYSYARRMLRSGTLPDPSTVRPEEFVNAFRQDYPQPPGAGFAVTTDGARLPDPDTRLLRIGLRTRSETPADRRDAALTFAVDVSGSMAGEGKLNLVKDSLHYLLGQLRPTDRVAVVAYSDEPRVLRSLTPVRERDALGRAIDELSPGGGTNLGAGVQTAYRVARNGFRSGATNRVVLLSDGLANQGDTEAGTILSKVSEQAGKGISLLCVGVGNDYGDALMERLADHGNGMAVYVGDRDEARHVFVDRLPANLDVRARDAKAQVVFEPHQVRSYRLIGFDDRRLSADQFRDDSVDGGWIGPGHSVTALYEVRLAHGASGRVAQVRVRWHDPDSGRAAEATRQVSVTDLDRTMAAAPVRLRADHAIAYFAEVLRDSRYARNVRLDSLAAEVDAAYRTTEDPDLRELARLIRTADRLS